MREGKRVYFDNAATTPIDRGVLKLVNSQLSENYGNPSSLHLEGRIAKKAIDNARKQIADAIGSSRNEIIFTSGGTESDNLAILGIARANVSRGKHIITSNIEHKAILDACKQLEKEGFEVTYLNVNNDGLVDVSDIERAIRQDTMLVSIMYANNEIGSIQPIKHISEMIKKHKMAKPIFHTDACQATNYLPIGIDDLGVDAMTISSSKIYGPKGVGCLYLRTGTKIQPIMFGGGQEKSIRSGTENVAGIVGFGEAFVIARDTSMLELSRLTKLRDYMLSEIVKNIGDVTINGGKKDRLPNNINVSIKGVEGESLVLMMDNFGVACSTGSACSSSDLNPSHVLVNIGTPIDLAHCSVRFSLGRYNDKKQVDFVLGVLADSVKKIRRMSSIK